MFDENLIFNMINRYASLFFAMCIDFNDNELIALETIHRYVETLDKYFGNVFSFILFCVHIVSINDPKN